MDDPKAQIYDLLKEVTLEGVEIFVSQDRPEVIAQLPAITFSISANVPKYDLSAEIAKQDIEVIVDIWTGEDGQNIEIMQQVEELMRGIKYLCTFNQDVSEPEPTDYAHRNLRFTY
jgi:hypothetical protein